MILRPNGSVDSQHGCEDNPPDRFTSDIILLPAAISAVNIAGYGISTICRISLRFQKREYVGWSMKPQNLVSETGKSVVEVSLCIDR